MTYVLGEPQDVGGYRIAVVSHQTVTGNRLGSRGAYCQCSKQPSFVVIRNQHVMTAVDTVGRKVEIATIAALCPGVADL